MTDSQSNGSTRLSYILGVPSRPAPNANGLR
jgi:hypothetical protein